VGDLGALLLPAQPPPGAVADESGPAARSLAVPLEVAARAVGGLIDGAVRDRAASLRAAQKADPKT